MRANHHTNSSNTPGGRGKNNPREIGVVAKQSLGQNFLMHQATANRIAKSADLFALSTVLEIGPGTGMLTKSLLAEAGHVVAVEADAELIPRLTETFQTEIASGKLTLVQGDVRTFDLSTLPRDYVAVANIPYYITGELLRFLLSGPYKPNHITFLVQKEVAVRITRSKKESLLSLSVKVFGTPKYRFTVPRGAFRPAPKVDSAVLYIGNITQPFSSPAEEERFFAVLHAGFAHKRKLLIKNLEAIATAGEITQAFSECGLNPKVRAEDVPVAVWKKLSSLL
ncbi:MAG: 16S rRNA (adenine(1518)-N(6)/adenine(1519)-N(6))-dimethyltransferase RsmA [Patescibacteria group bacterium]